MRKRALTLCLALLVSVLGWSPGTGWAQEAPASQRELTAVPDAEVLPPFLSTGNAPVKRSGCYISCNTDFNVFCSGSTYQSCFDSVDSGGYYISCDNVKYYCPPCPSWDPWHCVD